MLLAQRRRMQTARAKSEQMDATQLRIELEQESTRAPADSKGV